MNTNKKNNLLIFVLTLMLLGTSYISAQTLNKPTPADNPNEAGNSVWTAACASATFNEYYINFTWLPIGTEILPPLPVVETDPPLKFQKVVTMLWNWITVAPVPDLPIPNRSPLRFK